MKCLMVIDMQYGFKPSRKKWLIQNIKKRVKQARKDGIFILFVEYHTKEHSIDDHYGRTSKTIMKEVIGYDNCRMVVKTQTDGADEIYKFLEEIDIWPTEFEVCGVQTSACISQTVFGLALLNDISIFIMIENCLNDFDDEYYRGRVKETMEQFSQDNQFAII